VFTPVSPPAAERRVFGTLLGAAGTIDVDFAGEFGTVGQDRHDVVRHFDETSVHGHVDDGAVNLVHAGVVLDESTEEGHVPGQEGDLAPTQGARDDLARLARVQNAFGRDHLDTEAGGLG
jgi:hypothetical protein